MYAGMLIDTNYFRTHVGSRTFQVASKLKEMQANVSKAYEILQDDYKTTLEKMNISANAYRFGNDALIAYGNEEDIHTRPLLAKVGNELLNISEIKAVFVVGRVDKDKIAISARSKTGINVQLIMEKLGGGGHFSMAACQVEEKSIKETINKLEGQALINIWMKGVKRMKVVLLEDVRKIGKKGDVVTVSDGYGQNFLN